MLSTQREQGTSVLHLHISTSCHQGVSSVEQHSSVCSCLQQIASDLPSYIFPAECASAACLIIQQKYVSVKLTSALSAEAQGG